MGKPRRVWAISAIHAEARRLMTLHDLLYPMIRPGDRIVYLGNYTGYGNDPIGTINEILTFRRMVLSLPGMMAGDIAYLRGSQEEMWQKLLQIQFAPNPAEVLNWMYDNGLSQTLEAYDLDPRQGQTAAAEGVMSLTKWTGRIRQGLRQHAGHDIFSTHHRRAAYTDEQTEYPMLFVHTGINPERPLHDQGDNFWWGGKQFDSIQLPYSPFQKVVRGYDPERRGVHLNCVTASLDGGCGFGGTLVCAGFTPLGDTFELIET
jgi:serine/threonine protein phosphatase 1